MRHLLLNLLTGLCLASTAAAGPTYRFASGPASGPHQATASNIAEQVARPAGLALEVLASKGSIENVFRLRDDPGVMLALVQSDVYQAYMNQTARGKPEAERLVRPLRVVMPLHEEEIHVVVRADSPLNHLHEIRGRRINIGPVGSDAAVTGTTLYQALFGVPIAEAAMLTDSHETALTKLANDAGPEVVIVIGGQPMSLFTDMQPSAKGHFKLLRVSENAPDMARVLSVYKMGNIERSSYPNWVDGDVPALTTQTLLVTYHRETSPMREQLTQFSKAMCVNFDVLQAKGHAKWQKVKLELATLGKGWQYHEFTTPILRNCGTFAGSSGALRVCTRQDEILGLCAGPSSKPPVQPPSAPARTKPLTAEQTAHAENMRRLQRTIAPKASD